MNIRNFLMQAMELVTGHARYRPELLELNKKTHWSKDIWIINIFRLYEWLFGRGVGIRPESAVTAGMKNGKVIVEYRLFTIEAVLAHAEITLRGYFRLLFIAFKSLLTLKFDPHIDYKPAIVSFGILGLMLHIETSTKYLPLFGLAIAFDAAYQGDIGGNGNTLTYSHTQTGSNPILVVGGHTYVSGAGSTGDIITGCTYNGGAMSQVDKQLTGGGVYNRYQNLFILAGAATGAHNVVLSASTASYRLIASSESFSGAKQTGQPDASSKNTTSAVTSQALATTVVLANSWLCSSGVCTLDQITAGSGVTRRSGGDNFNTRIGDSNGGLTAGSNSMTWTTSIPSDYNVIQVSIAPAITGPTNVKKIGGVAIASVKVVLTTAIGVVKKIAGIA